MGNEISNGSPTDLEQMKRFMNMSPGQVRLIKEKFELMADEDLTIDRNGFAQLMKLKESEVDRVFQFFDLSNDGRIDSHEFVCALSLLSQASLKEKAGIVFSLYDFDHNKTITRNELVILIKTTLTALGAMSQKGECTIQEAEKISDDLLRKYDTNKDASISLGEFQSLLSKDAEVLKMLLSYGLCSVEDLRQDFGGQDYIPDPDSDLEVETQRKGLAYDQKREKRKIGIENVEEEENEQGKQIDQNKLFTKQNNKEVWKNQVKNGQPSNWKPGKGDMNPPATNLDLDYIYGFRSFDTRNNIKFVKQELVYFTAAVGIVYNPQTNQQKFFFEHTDDITCIDVYERSVATGQVGEIPTIYIWEPSDIIEPSKAAFKGVLREGVQCLAFSNDGKKLAAVGMDDDHTLVVYDVDKGIQQRKAGQICNALLATGKGPRSFVFDIKFDKVDKYLILACRNEVYFCPYDQGQIRLNKGYWDTKTCPISSVLCIGFCDNNVITGTYKGQLIIWKSNRATSQVDAHKGAVLAIHTRTSEQGGLITGSKDGTIAIWESSVKLKERILVLNLNLKIHNLKIQSVTENITNNGQIIVFGTRGSDMVELQGTKSSIIMRGHSLGTLRGLAMHPKQQTFYTIGEDNILACWLIKDKKMSSCMRLDYPSSAIHLSRDCKYLAVGSTNGTVLIIDPKTLMATFNFKDRDAEVSCLKFSPDTEYLAVGHDAPSCDVILYSIKSHFKRTNVLRGSPARVISIDFSINCKIVQVNDWSQQVLYYELQGDNVQKVQPDGAYRNKDEKWATYTAIYGWHVQSVWPQLSGGCDINAVDRSNKGDIIATADDYSSIKIFRYPASIQGQGYQRFVGHAAHVTNVRFSADDEYIISLGGTDKSIMQWKVYHDKESQIEQDHACETIQDIVIPQEYYKITLYEDEIKQDGQMKQYLGPVKATQPNNYKYDINKYNILPQGNIILDYILGIKTQQLDQEYFNGVKLLNDGKISYTCGSIGIIMDPTQQMGQQYYKQTYFRFHKEEITCIAIHPINNIIATGTRSFGLNDKYQTPICVWESESKKVLAYLNDFHTKMIHCLEFSYDGIFLISFSDEYSIAIHDWQIGQIIITIRTIKSLIYSICCKSPNEFMSCGLKSVTFYQMNGRNIKSTPGNLGGQQLEPMTCCCVAFKEYVTGSINGNIFLWKDTQSQRNYKAHQGKISSLIFVNKLLYSSGLDGKILIWEMNGNNLNATQQVYDLTQLTHQPKCGIISLQIKNDNVVIATKQAQIYYTSLKNFEGSIKKLLDSHYDGEIWGLGISQKSQTIITCGGDKILRQWDINQYTLLKQSEVFENDIRACDWSKDDKFIIVGDMKGFIFLIDPNTLNILDKKNSKFASTKQGVKQNPPWIEDIKFSPNCIKVAFGAHCMSSHIEVWEIEGQKLSKQSLINISLNGSLLKLDWAEDSNHLMVNSSSYELKFINVEKNKDVPGPQIKELEWSTQTCLFGFNVQGIYKDDEYNVTQVCLDNSKQIIAVGENTGIISLYKYPAVCQFNQVHKEYRAHANPITRIRFSYDDSKLITTSGMDRGIFIWKTDWSKQQQQIQQQADNEFGKYDFDSEDIHLIGIPQEKIKRLGGEKYGKVKRREQDNREEELYQDQNEKGDDFTVVRPWMGAIKEPSNYYKDPLNQNKQPLIELTLEYVHGYRSKDCRNNVKYLKGGLVVFNAAALAIVLDTNSSSSQQQQQQQLNQKFFNQHTDDVISIDVSLDQQKVATGQLGQYPIVYVWEGNTQQIICSFKGMFNKGVSSLSFNTSGDKLAAIGMDTNHSLYIFDIITKQQNGGGTLIITELIGTDIITDIKWKNDTEFTTCGINHLRFWKLTHNGLIYQKSYPQKPLSYKYLCSAVNGEDYLFGALDGSLQIFNNDKFNQHQQYLEINRALEAISVTKDFIFIGGRDAKICILDPKTYKLILSFKIQECIKGALGVEIKSIQLGYDQRTLLIGTNQGDILELVTKDAKININSKFILSKTLIKSHCAPNKRSLNEIWGLAVNPQDSDQFYTCGDDATLRSWSISQRRMLNSVKTNLDQYQNEIKPDEFGEMPDNTKGRCIAVSSNGIQICVGFKDGTVRIYDKEFKQQSVNRLAKEWISDIKFSGDSSMLALGSHDSSIYIYSFPEMKQKNKPLKKHSGYITHLDFSVDGNHLHSNCGSYELLFWELTTGKQLPNGANQLRDEKWLTWTTPLGWPVQGIWPEFQDGTDINTAVRSNKSYNYTDKPPDNYHLIATGDDNSNVKIFRYPCVKKGSQYILGKGHSSHISNVAWSVDDHFLFSIGGEDNCIFQWKVNKLR